MALIYLFPKRQRPAEDKYGRFLEINGAEFQIIVDGKEVPIKADAIAKDAPGEGIVEEVHYVHKTVPHDSRPRGTFIEDVL